MKCSCKMKAKKNKKASMYMGGGKMKKASMYKKGGKVKSLLKGLEGMPDRKGRKVMSSSERAMAPYKAGAKKFTKDANKFMEDMTGKRRPQK